MECLESVKPLSPMRRSRGMHQYSFIRYCLMDSFRTVEHSLFGKAFVLKQSDYEEVYTLREDTSLIVRLVVCPSNHIEYTITLPLFLFE